MYKLLKEKGHNANVSVTNTETGASVILGKLTSEILKALEGDGYLFDGMDGALKLIDRWELDISKETSSKLSGMAMKMKRPVRESKPRSEQVVPEPERKSNREIDAMDVLLGLAKYN